MSQCLTLFHHISVFVCMSVCVRWLNIFSMLVFFCLYVFVFVFVCVICWFALSWSSGRILLGDFLLVLRLVVVMKKKTGKMNRPPPPIPPTMSTQVGTQYVFCPPTHSTKKGFLIFAISCFLPSGPKLYKAPSAKSNKHIIQNALAHCCLAGKVNEGQKNKILDVCTVSLFLPLKGVSRLTA